jgi:hypothetical protein
MTAVPRVYVRGIVGNAHVEIGQAGRFGARAFSGLTALAQVDYIPDLDGLFRKIRWNPCSTSLSGISRTISAMTSFVFLVASNRRWHAMGSR